MMNGRNNGKKLMAIRIVAHAFEIVRAFFQTSLWRAILLTDIFVDSHHDGPKPYSDCG